MMGSKPHSLAIVARSDVDSAEWNAFVDRCDEAWLWHRHEFPPILATWRGWRDHSVGVIDPGTHRLETVLPLYHVQGRRSVLRFGGSLYSFGGPAIDTRLGERVRIRIREQLTDCLGRTARAYVLS